MGWGGRGYCLSMDNSVNNGAAWKAWCAASLAAAVVVGGLGGCEQKTPPPASAVNPGSRVPLGGLVDQPNSIPGKAAAAGRDAAKALESASQQAANVADQVQGQGSFVTVGTLNFRVPEGWKSIPPLNRMQTAALQVGENAQTICVFLTGIGGDTASNLNRWRTQVTDPGTDQPATSRVQNKTINGMKVTMVSMEGTYAAMTTGVTTKLPDQGFRGAIIEAPSGAIFVRLTGPVEAVNGATAAWEKMVMGLTQK